MVVGITIIIIGGHSGARMVQYLVVGPVADQFDVRRMDRHDLGGQVKYLSLLGSAQTPRDICILIL